MTWFHGFKYCLAPFGPSDTVELGSRIAQLIHCTIFPSIRLSLQTQSISKVLFDCCRSRWKSHLTTRILSTANAYVWGVLIIPLSSTSGPTRYTEDVTLDLNSALEIPWYAWPVSLLLQLFADFYQFHVFPLFQIPFFSSFPNLLLWMCSGTIFQNICFTMQRFVAFVLLFKDVLLYYLACQRHLISRMKDWRMKTEGGGIGGTFR